MIRKVKRNCQWWSTFWKVIRLINISTAFPALYLHNSLHTQISRNVGLLGQWQNVEQRMGKKTIYIQISAVAKHSRFKSKLLWKEYIWEYWITMLNNWSSGVDFSTNIIQMWQQNFPEGTLKTFIISKDVKQGNAKNIGFCVISRNAVAGPAITKCFMFRVLCLHEHFKQRQMLL